MFDKDLKYLIVLAAFFMVAFLLLGACAKTVKSFERFIDRKTKK